MPHHTNTNTDTNRPELLPATTKYKSRKILTQNSFQMEIQNLENTWTEQLNTNHADFLPLEITNKIQAKYRGLVLDSDL